MTRKSTAYEESTMHTRGRSELNGGLLVMVFAATCCLNACVSQGYYKSVLAERERTQAETTRLAAELARARAQTAQRCAPQQGPGARSREAR